MKRDPKDGKEEGVVTTGYKHRAKRELVRIAKTKSGTLHGGPGITILHRPGEKIRLKEGNNQKGQQGQKKKKAKTNRINRG